MQVRVAMQNFGTMIILYEPWFAIKLGRLLRGVPYVPITCTTRVERGTTLVSMAQYKANTIVEMCTIGHITYY